MSIGDGSTGNDPAGDAEDEAEGTVQRADLAVDDEVRDPHGDQVQDDERDDERAQHRHDVGDQLFLDVAARDVRVVEIGIRRNGGGAGPGRQRQHFPREAAGGCEDRRNQHEDADADIERCQH